MAIRAPPNKILKNADRSLETESECLTFLVISNRVLSSEKKAWILNFKKEALYI